MILKAGTYRFNDDISFDGLTFVEEEGMIFCQIPLNFKCDYLPTANCTEILVSDYGSSIGLFFNHTENIIYAYFSEAFDRFVKGWQLETCQTITLESEQEVDDSNGAWFITSTNYNEVNPPEAKPLAEITYNGETIAQLNAGETATLSCEGKKMASDVVVKVNKIEEPVDDSIGGVWKFDNTITPPNNISQLLLIFVCESDDGCGQGFNKIIFNYEGGEFKSMSLVTMAGADYEMYRVEGGWGMNTTIYVTPSCEYTSDTLDILKAIATKQ